MAQPINLAYITAMTINERIALVHAIWDSIAAEMDPVQLTEPQKRELDRRIAELDANPQNVRTWEEIKAHVRGRK
jgi:putative addiction module component (TIGR02574 family)